MRSMDPGEARWGLFSLFPVQSSGTWSTTTLILSGP